MLSGNNGILNQATRAKEQTEFGRAKEALALANSVAVLDKTVNGNNEILANVVSILRKEDWVVEQEKDSGATEQIIILDGETEISDNEIISLEKGATKVLNIDVQSVASDGQALPYYMLVSGRYHKILENEKGNLSLEETVTPESTVKGTTNNSATYALNLVSSDTENTNATITLNNGTITIVGNEKTTEDLTITIKYANIENVTDVKATKVIKIRITKQVISYGNKTATTIDAGEDLTIGTEIFRVLKTDKSSQIIAVPHYNITLVTPEDNDGASPEQMDATSGNTTTFSTSAYWTQGTDIIDMTDSRNNIQKYITAYSTKLSTATGGKVTARVARYSEMNASGVTNEIRNPGNKQDFWIGSGNNDAYRVWTVNRYRQCRQQPPYRQRWCSPCDCY